MRVRVIGIGTPFGDDGAGLAVVEALREAGLPEGIDAVTSRQIRNLLLAFVKGGGTIFLTSHILEIVERLSDHLGVIHQGRLVAQGPMDELRAGTGAGGTLEEIFLGLVGASEAEEATLDWLSG